jgi:molecular chaperone DnaJ
VSESYYDLLGVPSDASRDEVEQAFRERLKESHPDISDDEDAAARTRRLIEARDVLTDEGERDRYDRLGHERYVGVGGHGTNVGTTDGHEAPRGETPASANGRTGASTGSGRGDHVGSPGWSSRDGPGGSGGGRARDSEFATRRSETGIHSSRLFPPGPSLTLLLATFLTYPVVLWGALFPPFPLTLRVVIGICALLIVAYLQSLPEVGVVVFGAWSFLVPAGFLVLDAPLVSLVGSVAVLGTVLPLGLSALTWVVMR